MKKHQKVLLGLMALGLAGGIGTTLALTRNAADQSSISGGTDQAIYLNWGTDAESSAASAQIQNLKAQVTQYRHLVLAPQSSKSVEGTVKVSFALSVGENCELPGFEVKIYSATAVDQENDFEESALLSTLTSTSGDYSTSFDVQKADSVHTTTKYYTLAFTWDGTPLSNTSSNTSFGGSLKISQSFTATNGGSN